MTTITVCPICHNVTRPDEAHTCYDFDAVERLRVAERAVIDAAVQMVDDIKKATKGRGMMSLIEKDAIISCAYYDADLAAAVRSLREVKP